MLLAGCVTENPNATEAGETTTSLSVTTTTLTTTTTIASTSETASLDVEFAYFDFIVEAMERNGYSLNATGEQATQILDLGYMICDFFDRGEMVPLEPPDASERGSLVYFAAVSSAVIYLCPEHESYLGEFIEKYRA